MALQLTVKTSHGFSAENAYHRIEHMEVSNKTTLTFTVMSYKDNQEKVCFDQKSYSCDHEPSGHAVYKQAYEHLKKLPEFAGAIDC